MFFSIGQRGTCGEHTDVEIRKKSQYHTAAFLQQDTYTQFVHTHAYIQTCTLCNPVRNGYLNI